MNPNPLKIEHFLSSLPQSVLKGDDVSLPDNVIRKLFRFARLRSTDVFYHLGCGTNNTIRIAAQEFKVKKSVGIEIRKSLATKARNNIAGIANAQITNQDIRKVQISDASNRSDVKVRFALGGLACAVVRSDSTGRRCEREWDRRALGRI